MASLPVVTPRQLIPSVPLERAGWFVHHVRGSHHFLKHGDFPGLRITVAYHSRPLKRGTLRAILRQANLTADELRDLL
jgi:predicted RNA binding protein YcfA (HicA-like mRNA interferase family)